MSKDQNTEELFADLRATLSESEPGNAKADSSPADAAPTTELPTTELPAAEFRATEVPTTVFAAQEETIAVPSSPAEEETAIFVEAETTTPYSPETTGEQVPPTPPAEGQTQQMPQTGSYPDAEPYPYAASGSVPPPAPPVAPSIPSVNPGVPPVNPSIPYPVAPAPVTTKKSVNVGLLVWGTLLLVFGLMILARIFVPWISGAVVAAVLLAALGVSFLVGAITSAVRKGN